MFSGSSLRPRTLYFVEAPSVSLIKIGVTDDLDRRFRDLRMTSPVDLVLSLGIAGTGRQEHALHRAFARDRHHGEWFTATRELRDLIEWLRTADRRSIGGKLGSLVRAARPPKRESISHRERQRLRAQRLWRGVAEAWRPSTS